MAFVYILKSLKDGNFYIGSTPLLQQRIKQHILGQVKSTKSRLPIKLFAYQICNTIQEAALFRKKV